ncbi:MAG: nitroreductase family protein [Kiritimatiellae bacterium]|nr:nitroreductase family protein [Kiritimatiellia bacterium]
MTNQPTRETALFALNGELCVKCGACVRDCAFRALKTGPEGFPVMPDEAKCMHCQHCFAICPKGAITFSGHEASEAEPVRSLAIPKPEEVENWLKTRRSIRRYRDADVDRSALERILKSLGNVPTGCNARGLTFSCYPDRASMNAFRHRFVEALESHRDGGKLLPRWLAIPAIKLRKGGEDILFRGATGMLVVSSDERNPAVTTPKEDVILALACFELLAEANGIGTCWCGFLNLAQGEVPEISDKVLGLRRGTPFYAMLFGLPAVSYPRTVVRESDAKVEWR